MVLLGVLVGHGSTRLDDWFLRDSSQIHDYRRALLLFTDARLLICVWLACLAAALWRRQWRVGAAVVVTPAAAYLFVQVCKRLFDRQKDGLLAYPSGHVTLGVVVLGLVAIVAGWQMWAVAMAVLAGTVGMIGQALTYHYFTDTVGAVLLGTAIVCMAAMAARCTPVARTPT
jgi:membrane-associated phospholipid phosphatase